MSLLQISEPGQTTAPHQRKLAVGIDLGTTNSLVASVRSGKAETLPDEQNRHLLPSVVQFTQDLVLVGDEAKSNLVSDPSNTIASVKRFMGRSLKDIRSRYPRLPYAFKSDVMSVFINTLKGEVNPVQVSAEILKKLKKRAENTLGDELQGAVITVPAYFDDAQRQGTKDAAQLAGLNVLRLLNEPTAAAIAYGLDSGRQGTIVVYDLGGGTFDISVLRLTKGVFEVLATGGDSALGGDDFDARIVEYVIDKANLAEKLTPQAISRLNIAAKTAKEALTNSDSTVITINDVDDMKVDVELSKACFERLIEPLIKKTLKTTKRTLKDAHVDVSDIMEVVMVGGSTRVPSVRSNTELLFQKTLLTSIDPDKVVAIGAAVQADILVGNKPDSEMLLLDVLPLSLGLETMGDLVEKIIPRNTTIPISRAQEFTTFKDGQTAMALHVLQGEREVVKDCRSLARFSLKGIPPMAAGAAHIRVTFQVDADGLLSVTAMEKSSGVSADIQVKPSYGLSDEEVASMLKASFVNAKQDMRLRMLKEQQVEAKRVEESITSAISADGGLLDEKTYENIIEALQHLKQAADGQSVESIKTAIETVDTLTQAFAAARMDKSIRTALSGQSVDEV